MVRWLISSMIAAGKESAFSWSERIMQLRMARDTSGTREEKLFAMQIILDGHAPDFTALLVMGQVKHNCQLVSLHSSSKHNDLPIKAALLSQQECVLVRYSFDSWLSFLDDLSFSLSLP